ncbi:MAG: tRNA (adenosine(37)-N6)-threonylcarbamoyltransferase complex ATPase subunit type 1 TsaE [Bacteroidetes bacterium]|nr:tRNA (adenosine(37)-N6)-threonylcarbamoyltransferase complex ATPase subunit type 1 TsaE [Bacteroidota bacterium]
MQQTFQFHLKDIHKVAGECLAAAGNHKVWLFYGEMGAGKTTFVHALCDVLGVKDAVGSPTFSIINEYVSASGETIYHLDLYRLASEEEVVRAGAEEIWYSDCLSFTEWPEKAGALLPAEAVKLSLRAVDNELRELQIFIP